MVADSCVTYGTPEALVCPPCRVTVPFYLRFSVFTFHPYLRIRCFGCCSAPTNSLQRSVWYVPILGDLSMVLPILSHRPLSLCLRLTSALSRWRPCFCWLLLLPKLGWGATGSLFHSHLCGWGWLPFLHPAVGHQVGVAHPFLFLAPSWWRP